MQQTYFPCFEDGYRQRYKQSVQDVMKAHQTADFYNNMDRLGVSSNRIDFSNPESVARMQNPYYYQQQQVPPPQYQQPPIQPINPYGYNNPNMNPNFRYQPPQGTWYGVNPYYQYQQPYWYNPYEDTSFMIPTIEDIENGNAVKAKIVDISEYKEPQTNDDTGFDEFYKTLDSKKVIARVVVITPEQKEAQRKVDLMLKGEALEEKEEEDTLEEDIKNLDVDKFIMPEETEMIWKQEDYDREEEVAERMAVYNEAYAQAIYNLENNEEIKSREDFDLYINYAEDKIKKFKKLEELHPNKDYRVPLRYKRPPRKWFNKRNNKWEYIRLDDVQTKRYNQDGTRHYSFDLGRKITKKEGLEFYKEAIWFMKKDVDRIRLRNIIKYNKNLQETVALFPKDEDVEDGYYNPLDPVARQIHQMKMRKLEQEHQYKIYKGILRYKFKTNEDFDNWWFGRTQNRNNNGNINRYDQRREYLDRMTAQNIMRLNSIIPVNQQQRKMEIQQRMNRAINNFDENGRLRNSKSAAEYFENMAFALQKLSDENLERQREERYRKTIGKYDFEKTILSAFNEKNDNRKPGVKFGLVDPSLGLPPNYVDFRKCDDYAEKKRQFLECVKNQTGTIPLKPIYK